MSCDFEQCSRVTTGSHRAVVKYELKGREAALVRNKDGRAGMVGVGNGEDVRAAHQRWSVNMRGVQIEAQLQLSGRVVSREEVTALVKERHPDIAR
jgi:hypothetical protein